ncbi:hypothetical protein HPB50_013537 [Hyalomma asiaticum]|uniref:Uncharacterized protein n=1 Tax=Hyalomma asiaticum TaxID=266040 RepID=A0ACB7T645_HYAAI|nr:hypothetical protein HPB50_013537 [Hyalomma asiaticum]
MASSTYSISSGSRSRDDASPGPSPEHTTASSPNNGSVRAGQTVILLFPLPKVLRCTEDDCRHSYAPVSWTSRVQSLLQHASRPTTHACLRGGAVEESASPARYRCDRCSASFPSSRGLVNHRLWHRDRDARVATRRTTPTTRRPPRLTNVPTSSRDFEDGCLFQLSTKLRALRSSRRTAQSRMVETEATATRAFLRCFPGVLGITRTLAASPFGTVCRRFGARVSKEIKRKKIGLENWNCSKELPPAFGVEFEVERTDRRCGTTEAS